jgi:hypothetical protein
LKLLGPDLVCVELKRPWSDGTSHVTMSPQVFVGRLASLVPRPRANTTLYAGVLAPHAKDRPRPRPDAPRRHRDASWAALMRHSFGLDVLSCPRCKGRLRFVATLIDRADIQRLLTHLHLWADPLPPHPPRGPPEHPDMLDFP